ncbi:hypothetical protein Tco_0587347, partial [Tanacetum coccineum]
GKGIATDEQAAQSLLDMQKPKNKSTTDQYIFQRRILVTQDTSTGPSAHPLHNLMMIHLQMWSVILRLL